MRCGIEANATARRVMLIATEPTTATVIRDLLASTGETGWSLEWVASPALGFEYLSQHQVDVLVLDLSSSESATLQTLRDVHRRASGTPIVVLVSASHEATATQAMDEGAQDYLITTQVDGPVLLRTLRSAMEHKRLEERLRLFVDHSQEVIFRYRLMPTPGFEYVSPAVTALTGYAPAEFLADPALPFKMVHSDDRWLLTAAGYAFSVGRNVPHRARWRRKDGTVIWTEESLTPIYDSAGNLVAVEGAARDVTEREQTADGLRRSERRFRLLVEHAADVVAILDAAGVTRYVSPSVERILGYQPEDLLDSYAFEFVHPDDRPGVLTAFANVIQDPQQATRVEFRCRHADGSWRILEALGENLLDDPDLAGVGLTLRDVTERKRLEESLLQAQKLEAMGRLADGIVHDFRTVLTAVKGFSETLHSWFAPTDPRREILMEITKAGEVAETLTNQLLAFSQQRKEQPATLDLNALIRRADLLLRMVAGDGIKFRISLAPEAAWIAANRGQIEQVLINLASNARDAMPRGGQLTITTAIVAMDDSLMQHLPGIFPGAYVVLAVRDTGTGMDAATRARMFEPFFTTKEVGRGTGLGLATVDAIVRQNGGTVDVESAPGCGSTFTIYLPLVDAPRPASDSTDTP